VGRYSSSSERAFAGFGARNVSRFTYQLGNFFASKNATIQTTLAVSFGNNFGLALAITAAIVAIAVSVVTALGPEARGVKFGEGHPSP
jgi:hypothetical protein